MQAAKLSVIVITFDSLESVLPLLRALSRQTARERMEVIVAAPAGLSIDDNDDAFAPFARHQVLTCEGEVTTSTLRAAGVRAATAPVVAFTEEHCFPAARWAETFIERHREPWAGVGGVFVNGNPSTGASWANFLIEYGPLADPLESGEVDLIAGHNSSYKRDLLLAYGDRLADALDVEPATQWELQTQGHRFFNDSRAKCVHYNVSRFGASVRLRFHCGRLFAGNRAKEWSTFKRLTYAIAWPLIPCVRLWRMRRIAQRIGETGRVARLSPLIAMLLAVDAFGEMVGYLTGPGRSLDHLTDIEIHRERYLHPRDRSRYLHYGLEAVPA